jgi:hypothetical protein
MAEVYLAEDTRLQRKVALKLLPSAFTQDVDSVRRFEQEARTVSALNHPNIVTIYEIGLFNDRQYIATELIEGSTLRDRMSERLTLHEVLDVAIQVGSALTAAHRAGVVHRDIKPENIMLRPDGYLKVLDFGLAKLTDNERNLATTKKTGAKKFSTAAGIVLGTAGYMYTLAAAAGSEHPATARSFSCTPHPAPACLPLTPMPLVPVPLFSPSTAAEPGPGLLELTLPNTPTAKPSVEPVSPSTPGSSPADAEWSPLTPMPLTPRLEPQTPCVGPKPLIPTLTALWPIMP